MAEEFDPYHKWLGIPPKDQPPTYYRLLGLEPFENDPDVIESAADRQMAHLRSLEVGLHGSLSQQLLNEVVGNPVNLLERIEPARHAVHGDWRFEGNQLVSPERLNWARIEVPGEVPDEYILTVEIAQAARQDNLNLGLVAGGSQFMYCVSAFGKGGLFLLDGKEWHVNETSYPVSDLFHGGPNTVTCIVHRGGIITLVNDRTLIDWEGDFARLSLQSLWRMPSQQALFLGTGPRYSFTKVELQPIQSHTAPNDH